MSLDYILGYNETIKNRINGKLETDPFKFNKIYPTSCGTTDKQITPLNPEGLTLVAFLDKGIVEKLDNVAEQIKTLNRSFCPVRNLHTTFLGNYPCGVINENPIKKKIYEYFKKRVQNGYELDFELDFKHVRPGKSKKIVDASDGTVVAIGDLESEGNREFV